MKVLKPSDIACVAGGSVATVATLVGKTVASAYLYEVGRQVVNGSYYVANTYVKPRFMEAPAEVVSTGFQLQDFDVPASYIATFVVGAALGAAAYKYFTK